MALLAELRRRRVFRVAAVYGAASWIITEVTATVFPPLGIPDWTVTFLIVLLILGFPCAMIFAWIYDVGPGGLRRTEPLERAQRAVETKRGRLLYLGLLVLAMAALVLLLDPFSWRADKDPERNSIAVLPFINLSNDEANDYFSDGMSEELLNLLAKVPGLKVAARTSSFAFRDQQVDVREVASQLGVQTVLEGSVRWSGERQVRITAQLIDAETGYHLWSHTYDEELENIFDVQDKISAEIVKALRIELSEPDQEKMHAAQQPPTTNVKAYEDYLQGRHYWKRRGEEPLRRSIDFFQASLGRDPGFGRASAALAAAYVLMPQYAGEPAEVYFPLAADAARQALVLDEHLAEAHAVLAKINSDEGNWTDAESGYFFAISLEPDEPTAHQWYSMLLLQTGRIREALEEAQKAHDLDPTSPVITGHLANSYLIVGDSDRALEFAQQSDELGLAQDLSIIRAFAHWRSGNLDEAVAAFEAAPELRARSPGGVREWLLATQDPEAAQALLAEVRQDALQSMSHESALVFFATLGDLDRAFEAAGRLAGDKRLSLALLWGPEMRAMREDPRMEALVKQVGLLDYWRQYGWPDQCQPSGDGFACTG